MGSPILFKDFQRWFARQGVEIVPARGSHYKFSRVINGITLLTIVPVSGGRLVKDVYLNKARRTLKLTPSDGVSDEEFFK